MNRLSLHTRLVAVAVALVAFAVTATGVATYLALSRYLVGSSTTRSGRPPWTCSAAPCREVRRRAATAGRVSVGTRTPRW